MLFTMDETLLQPPMDPPTQSLNQRIAIPHAVVVLAKNNQAIIRALHDALGRSTWKCRHYIELPYRNAPQVLEGCAPNTKVIVFFFSFVSLQQDFDPRLTRLTSAQTLADTIQNLGLNVSVAAIESGASGRLFHKHFGLNAAEKTFVGI